MGPSLSVGKRVYINQLELAVDDSCKHRLQFLVFIGQLALRRPRGATWHGYLQCRQMCPGPSFLSLAEMDGGVQRVGKAVSEHP